MAAGRPDAELTLDTRLVRALIGQQCPWWADLPLLGFSSGWDNEIFRLGADKAVRLPRRALAVPLMRNEQRWLPVLAPRLPLPIPAPIHCGAPAAGYPWPWSVVPWLPGSASDHTPPRSPEAPRWASFLRALHTAAPPDAPMNPFRGVPLAQRGEALEERVARLRAQTSLITPGIERVWRDALAAPPARERVWLHGDLHSQNVLTRAGRISAVIDWGT